MDQEKCGLFCCQAAIDRIRSETQAQKNRKGIEEIRTKKPSETVSREVVKKLFSLGLSECGPITPEGVVESAARQNNRALITIPRVPVPWCEERDIKPLHFEEGSHIISWRDLWRLQF